MTIEAELGCLPESVLGIVRHGPKRRCLQSMIVGQTSAFFLKEGEEHSIYQAANERWVKDAGWNFTIQTGCFVTKGFTSSKVILITRTK